MRKLMWFSLGFGAACVWGGYCGNRFWLVLAGLMIAAAILLGVLSRSNKRLRAGMLMCIGAAVGLGWFQGFDALYVSHARDFDGCTVPASIRASGYSRETQYGYAVDGTMTIDGKSYQVAAYLDSDENASNLAPGDVITGQFRFRLTTPGGSGESAYYQGKRIFLRAYQTGDAAITFAGETALRDAPAVLRKQILDLTERLFPADTEAFAKALLLGDTSALTYEMDTAFQISGIRHVVAVSGLHVSILFSVIYLLCAKRRWVTALLGIPTLILFAAVAGLTPSVTRACVMQGLMILAMLVKQEYDPPSALSFAALVMLAVNPLVITSVSFQLSVGCMIGIFLFARRVSGWILSQHCLGSAEGKSLKSRLKRWAAGSVSVTLSSMVFTTPLCALYFGVVSLIGVVTNLLTLWLITVLFYGIMAACILGAVWLPLGSTAAWVVSWGIRLVQWIARTLAAFPLAAVYTTSVYIVLWLILCYVLFICFLVMKKKPVEIFLCCAVLSLCAALFASWAEPKSQDCRVTVLDVGQGQCILLQSQERTFLVDCGGDSGESAADCAAQTLLSQGISHLDGLLLTHYDADHAGGAANLLTRVDADVIFLPEAVDETGITAEIAAVTEGEILRVRETLEINWGDSRLTIYPPVLANSDNESSLCVLFQAAECDILITGDRDGFGERMLLRNADIPELEVLIVGHHGSKTATCDELLAATTPEYAFISVGADNRYGHPAQEVLDRLTAFGCIVYRTDQHGTITFGR